MGVVLSAVTAVYGGLGHEPSAPKITFNSCTYDLFFAEPLILDTTCKILPKNKCVS